MHIDVCINIFVCIMAQLANAIAKYVFHGQFVVEDFVFILYMTQELLSPFLNHTPWSCHNDSVISECNTDLNSRHRERTFHCEHLLCD